MGARGTNKKKGVIIFRKAGRGDRSEPKSETATALNLEQKIIKPTSTTAVRRAPMYTYHTWIPGSYVVVVQH